jgi:hypothetical protein
MQDAFGVDRESVSKGLASELFVGEKAKYAKKEDRVGYIPGKGGRTQAMKTSAREAAFFSPRGTNRKKNWAQAGANAGAGIGGGAAVGAGIGAALGGKAGAVRGAAVGGLGGGYVGATNTYRMRSNRSLNRAFDEGVKNGTMRKPKSGEKVNWKGSVALKKKS